MAKLSEKKASIKADAAGRMVPGGTLALAIRLEYSGSLPSMPPQETLDEMLEEAIDAMRLSIVAKQEQAKQLDLGLGEED